MSASGPKTSSGLGGLGDFGDNYHDDDMQGLFAEINITPLTDVVFVLLIICMVTTSAMVDAAREGRLDITLPAASSGSRGGEEQKSMVVGIAADGRVYIDGTILREDELQAVLQKTYQTDPKTVMLVEADGDLPHKKVVMVIDMIRKAGFTSVGIQTENKDE